MSFFRRPDYVSDATQFIEQLKREHPQLEAEQRQGRALLWDKSISRDDQKDFPRPPHEHRPQGTAACTP